MRTAQLTCKIQIRFLLHKSSLSAVLHAGEFWNTHLPRASTGSAARSQFAFHVQVARRCWVLLFTGALGQWWSGCKTACELARAQQLSACQAVRCLRCNFGVTMGCALTERMKAADVTTARSYAETIFCCYSCTAAFAIARTLCNRLIGQKTGFC